MSEEFVGGKEASKILGVHQRTLYQWEEKGWIDTIRTPGNKRLYNVKKYLEEHTSKIKEVENYDELDEQVEKLNICYARVSSHGQENDLQRQKELLKKSYPEYYCITDIGSGINFNRRGIRKIIHYAIQGKINEVVVVHKDRLTRFGYELIEDLITTYSNGKITILQKSKELEPQEELVMDVLQILNVFTAKMNGLRKYKKKKNEEESE
jgi:putative resolvase